MKRQVTNTPKGIIWVQLFLSIVPLGWSTYPPEENILSRPQSNTDHLLSTSW